MYSPECLIFRATQPPACPSTYFVHEMLLKCWLFVQTRTFSPFSHRRDPIPRPSGGADRRDAELRKGKGRRTLGLHKIELMQFCLELMHVHNPTSFIKPHLFVQLNGWPSSSQPFPAQHTRRQQLRFQQHIFLGRSPLRQSRFAHLILTIFHFQSVGLLLNLVLSSPSRPISYKPFHTHIERLLYRRIDRSLALSSDTHRRHESLQGPR